MDASWKLSGQGVLISYALAEKGPALFGSLGTSGVQQC